MKYIGAHVSISGGVSNAPVNANSIGAKSFALFTKSPSRWNSPIISDKEANLFKDNCIKFGYSPEHILVHDSYLINLGAPDGEKLKRSRESFIEELQRCEQLGLTLLNFHPGSHLNLINTDKCLDLIAESINIALNKTSGITAVIENTAGQGSNLGFDFSQIAHIIAKIEDKSRIGVCIDTCHAFAAGYDLSTQETYNSVWNQFDEIIGNEFLRGIHLNDTKKGLSSKVDRHESIGKGLLGVEFFKIMMNDSRFDNIPLILETPDSNIWAEEINWLYNQEKQYNIKYNEK